MSGCLAASHDFARGVFAFACVLAGSCAHAAATDFPSHPLRLIVPAATPRLLVARLNAEFVRVLSTPETRERFAAMGADAAHSTPEEFRDFILAEEKKWAGVVRESGIRVEFEQ